MGKRELVLIAVFVVLGVLVYQVTAPPPAPGSEGVSLRGMIRNMKRGVQGSRATAPGGAKQTVAVPASLKEVRINISRPGDLTVTGEDRLDVAAEMSLTARGFDEGEAKAVADAHKLKVEQAGDALVVTIDTTATRGLPRNWSISQMAVALKVPRRLSVRIEPHVGRMVLSQLAGAEVVGSRGETRITGFTGRVTLAHSSGALEIDDLPSLKLNARNSRGSIKRVGGPMSLDSIGGEVTISGIVGPLEVEARNTDLRVNDLKALKGPLRINATGGEIRIDGVRTETRLDGRNSMINVTLGAPAPVTIYNLGEIRVSAPPGGYTLDAVATEGRIVIEDGDVKPSEGPDPRATGPVRGGGPTLSLRATRGSITVRKPDAVK